MLHVLRHYLPFQKTLLIASETVLITLVVLAGLSSHLWRPTDNVTYLLARQGLDPEAALWRTLLSSVLVAVLAQVAIAFNELYDFRISGSRYERAARFLGSAGSAVVLVVVAVALMEVAGVERLLDFPGLPLTQTVVILTFTTILAFTLLYFWRNLFHGLLVRANLNARLLILGSGRLAQRLVEDLRRRQGTGFDLVGVVYHEGSPRERRRRDRRRDNSGRDPDAGGTGNPWFEAAAASATETPPGRLVTAEGLAMAAGGERLVLAVPPAAAAPPAPRIEPGEETIHAIALRLDVDAIIVALEERRGSLPTEDLLACRLDGIVVEEAEAFYERLTGQIPAEGMRPSYLIFNPGFRQHPLAEALKRVVDIALALVGIALSWPLMLATALAVRLDSPGPIFFRQERTGAHGRPFTLLKFRSMRTDAERETGPVWASQDDPRITRAGRILRKSRLDELPQLFNVLGGTMSMVGPRPERPAFVEELAAKIPYYSQRHIVKPGITGWAQINYPYGNTLEDALQKLQYDLFYIKYQSTIFDLSILFHTVKTVLLRRGT
ncbi:MAG: TIGR03013 family XrtA/PEP-CTERM system glycosyltransferase [Planctomycetota bacterium]